MKAGNSNAVQMPRISECREEQLMVPWPSWTIKGKLCSRELCAQISLELSYSNLIAKIPNLAEYWYHSDTATVMLSRNLTVVTLRQYSMPSTIEDARFGMSILDLIDKNPRMLLIYLSAGPD